MNNKYKKLLLEYNEKCSNYNKLKDAYQRLIKKYNQELEENQKLEKSYYSSNDALIEMTQLAQELTVKYVDLEEKYQKVSKIKNANFYARIVSNIKI